MKNILQLLSLSLFVVTLSSCDIGAGGYVGAGPAYGRPRPYYNNENYTNGYYNNRYYGHNHPTYYRSEPRPAGVNARVNARVLPLNVSSSTGLGLF